MLGQRTIERNQLLVKIAKSKLVRRHDEKNEKVTKPEELVRLYDLLLQVSSFMYSYILFRVSVIGCSTTIRGFSGVSNSFYNLFIDYY